eukprot:2430123-Pyramimonas_sp.AAC.1
MMRAARVPQAARRCAARGARDRGRGGRDGTETPAPCAHRAGRNDSPRRGRSQGIVSMAARARVDQHEGVRALIVVTGSSL